MNALEFLVPISIALGALGLGLFFLRNKNGENEDEVGAAQRIFIDDDDKPL